MDRSPPGSSVHGDSPGKNTGVGCHALLQGIFPTQGSHPGLPRCRQILYSLSPQGSSCLNKHSLYFLRASPGGSDGKEFASDAGDLGSIPGSEDPLEKGMATHSSILAWRIPWTE